MAAVNLLARGFRFEVSTDNSTWVRPKGLNNLNPKFDANLEDAGDYDSDGWGASEITLNNWSVAVGMNRKADAGVEDAGQALIRACLAQFGDGARLYVRWYRTDGIDEAWTGRAIVSVENANTGLKDIAAWNVTFTGDGLLTKITNPYSASLAPVVTSATPSGAAAGSQVTVKGQYFTGASAVKFGAASATTYTVVSDSTVVVVMPAGTAGSAPVTVTNSTGVSNSLAYTRGA